jgi:hypothetical protein
MASRLTMSFIITNGLFIRAAYEGTTAHLEGLLELGSVIFLIFIEFFNILRVFIALFTINRADFKHFFHSVTFNILGFAASRIGLYRFRIVLLINLVF